MPKLTSSMTSTLRRISRDQIRARAALRLIPADITLKPSPWFKIGGQTCFLAIGKGPTRSKSRREWLADTKTILLIPCLMQGNIL